MRDADWMATLAATPADDRLRRRFADELAAAGDPWAELVALQLGRVPGAPRLPSVREREAARIDLHGPRWTGALVGRPGVREVGFVRGAPGHLALDAAALRDGAARAAIAGLPIEHLDVVGLAGDVGLIAGLPGRERLVSLGLADGGLDDAGVAALAAFAWPALRWLDLAGNPVGRPGVEQIAAASGLADLGFLGLERTGFDPREQPGSVDWDGTIVAIDLPAAGAELVERFGERTWLRLCAASYADYPPRRW